jgi:hypothetical protein
MVWFGKLYGPIFTLLDIGLAFLVLSHEDVEGGIWALLWLASLILLLLAIV